MRNSIYQQLVPVLLLLGCTRAMSDELETVAKAGFSNSSSSVVLRVTWSDARTPRRWSRSFFGDARVEASDVGFDGNPVEPPVSWRVEGGRLMSELAAAVDAGLTTSTQERMLERIRSTGRDPDYAEDEISLTVELRFVGGTNPQGPPAEVVQVFRIRDPLGMARRFPDVPELAALASLFEFARHSEPQ